MVPVTEHTAPPDPAIFVLATMFPLPDDSPLKLSADGKSVITTSLNSGWVWTYAPFVK